jgi:hypothetical protein
MNAAPAADYFEPACHDIAKLVPTDSFCVKLHPGASEQRNKNTLLLRCVN